MDACGRGSVPSTRRSSVFALGVLAGAAELVADLLPGAVRCAGCGDCVGEVGFGLLDLLFELPDAFEFLFCHALILARHTLFVTR